MVSADTEERRGKAGAWKPAKPKAGFHRLPHPLEIPQKARDSTFPPRDYRLPVLSKTQRKRQTQNPQGAAKAASLCFNKADRSLIIKTDNLTCNDSAILSFAIIGHRFPVASGEPPLLRPGTKCYCVR